MLRRPPSFAAGSLLTILATPHSKSFQPAVVSTWCVGDEASRRAREMRARGDARGTTRQGGGTAHRQTTRRGGDRARAHAGGGVHAHAHGRNECTERASVRGRVCPLATRDDRHLITSSSAQRTSAKSRCERASSRAARDEFLFFHTRRVAKSARTSPANLAANLLLHFFPFSVDPKTSQMAGRSSPATPEFDLASRGFPGGAPRRRASLRRRGRSRDATACTVASPLVLVRLARVIPHLRERSHGLRATERGSGPGPVGRGATVHLRRRRRLLRAVQPGHAPRATFRTAPRAHRVWVFVRTRGRVAETVRVTVGVSGRAADGRVVVRPRGAPSRPGASSTNDPNALTPETPFAPFVEAPNAGLFDREGPPCPRPWSSFGSFVALDPNAVRGDGGGDDDDEVDASENVRRRSFFAIPALL